MTVDVETKFGDRAARVLDPGPRLVKMAQVGQPARGTFEDGAQALSCEASGMRPRIRRKRRGDLDRCIVARLSPTQATSSAQGAGAPRNG